MDIKNIQHHLRSLGVDGWLLYDFKRSNPIAHALLIPTEHLLTRRFFYWIPLQGEPVKIVHRIESETLDHLIGRKETYTTWQEIVDILQKTLYEAKQVAMEHSPQGAIPEISHVDGGTIDLIRSLGPDVISSGDLLLLTQPPLSQAQWESHFAAAKLLDQSVSLAWQAIEDQLGTITEYDVMQLILNEMKQKGFTTEAGPICAVNEHSANPHYIPTKETSRTIHKGDFVLLDLWCKENKPGSLYADITRVGVAASTPTDRQQEIFTIVKRARDTATDAIRAHSANRQPITGADADRICRHVIDQAGYGAYFIHRTGHNIAEQDHGPGTHIDSFETDDHRLLLPGTLFSIEPGIYLPGEFGVRLEYDICLLPDSTVKITGGIQESLMTIG